MSATPSLGLFWVSQALSQHNLPSWACDWTCDYTVGKLEIVTRMLITMGYPEKRLTVSPGITWPRRTCQQPCLWVEEWMFLGTWHVYKGRCGKYLECHGEYLPLQMLKKQTHGSDAEITDRQHKPQTWFVCMVFLRNFTQSTMCNKNKWLHIKFPAWISSFFKNIWGFGNSRLCSHRQQSTDAELSLTLG